MRIGAAFEPTAAAYYRGVYPLEEMQRRGHEIVWPEQDSGDAVVDALGSCDVVFVFRRHEEGLRRVLKRLAADGVGIVWDCDDNLAAVPKSSPNYRQNGGLRGERRFAETIRMASIAHVVTVTTEPLAARYAEAGISNIEVIDNYLRRRSRRPSTRHPGIVVGWIAGWEHRADAIGLGITDVLARLQGRYADLQVQTVGVDLELPERYTRHATVHFNELPEHMGTYDIGLAPLVDIPFNTTRSSIKIKEYAASAVPWLASPRAPYRGYGEEHGGILVGDNDWESAIDSLIRDKRQRKRLARAGRSWAKSQTVESVASRWERIFEIAISRAAHVTVAS